MIGLASVKGSPGVTTTALAMVAGEANGLLVELDPSGGTVGSWSRPTGEPGLLTLASRLRREASIEVLDETATDLGVGGATAISAPTGEPQARAAVGAAWGHLSPMLARLNEMVVVDLGRWSPSQESAGRLIGCEVVGLVCRPTVAGIESVRSLLSPLGEAAHAPVGVLLIGDRPYGPAEVATTLGVPAVAIDWDSRGAEALRTGTVSRAWRRTHLARSTQRAVQTLRSWSSASWRETSRAG